MIDNPIVNATIKAIQINIRSCFLYIRIPPQNFNKMKQLYISYPFFSLIIIVLQSINISAITY